MKKLLAITLALVMVLSLTACFGSKTPATEAPTEAPTQAPTEAPTEEPTVGGVETPDLPIEEETEVPAEQPSMEGAAGVLNTIWALHTEDQKFMAYGGSNMVPNAAGAMDITDADNLTYQLLVPAEQIANIDDAAGLFHGMMLNNFTAGAFHVTGDAKAFAEAMHTAVANNQWMCGFPEQLLIAVVDSEYVVMVYGLGDFINNFNTHMTAAYPEAEVLYNEALEA